MARLTKKAEAAIQEALSLNTPLEQAGLGIDLVDVDRMRAILARTPSFSEKVFSEDERTYCEGKADPAMHYAARFAAKEAVVKALGAGFTQGIACKDIAVAKDKAGKPYLTLAGNAQKIAQDLGITAFPISLSHTKEYAIACAIAITNGVKAQTEAKRDSEAELAQQFKEVRKMLDVL